MIYEVAVDCFAAIGDSGDAKARILLQNCQGFAIIQFESSFLKQRHRYDVLWVRRRVVLETDGVEHVPRRHLSRVIHSRHR